MATKVKPKKLDLSQGVMPGTEPIDTTSHRDNLGISLQEDEHKKLLEQFRQRAAVSHSYWAHIYRQAADDVEFIYGDQWDVLTRSNRQDRPSLQMNVLPKFIWQVTGMARKSRFSIQVDQTSGDSHPFVLASGVEEMNASEVMDGMIRQIERRSFANQAYCNAMQHALEGGVGWLKVDAVQRNDDPFNAELEIGYVQDRYAVLFDQYGLESPGFRDAMWCSESVMMSRAEFETRYPDIPAQEFGNTFSEIGENFDQTYWGDNDHIRVTDYWFKHPTERKVVRFLNTKAEELVLYEDDHGDVFDELLEMGYRIAQEKTFMTYKVHMMRCVYNHILEGPFNWPSMYLPRIPVLGHQVDRQNSREYLSLTRIAKDPMRMVNYWFSTMTEVVGASSHDPWIMTADQIGNYREYWENMNDAAQKVLIYEYQEDQPAPQRSGGSTLPTAELQVLLTAKEFVMDTIGMSEASLGQPSTERTGIAVHARNEIDSLSNYTFMSNILMSIKQAGYILCDMIPKIYSNDQARQIIRPDETSTMINLNHQIMDEESGRTVTINNLSMARYECAVDVGPGVNTVRTEFVNMATELIKSVPQLAAILPDMIIQNMPIPNSKEAARRAHKLVPRHLLSEEEQAKMPPPEPTPEQQVEAKKAEAEIAKATSTVEISKLQLEIQNSKVEEARLRVEETRLRSTINAGKAVDEGARDPEVDEKKMEAVAKRVMAGQRAGRRPTKKP